MKSRRSIRHKAAVGTLKALVLGLTAVVVYQRTAEAHPGDGMHGHHDVAQEGGPDDGRPGGAQSRGPLESVLQRLDLTPDQQAEIEQLLDEDRRRLHNLIRGVLTAEQAALFNQLTSRPNSGPGGRPGGTDPVRNNQGRTRPGASSAVSRVEITVQGDYRFVRSNGIPDHPIGQFPNRGNPNAVEEQTHNFRIPLRPQIAEQVTPVRHDFFGVALTGVPFDAATGEFWNNDRRWNYDALSGAIDLGMDANNAHVQPGGVYHYHGLPSGLINKLGAKNQMTLVGYAADGFPIYTQYGYSVANDAGSAVKELNSSYRLKPGTRPGGQEGPGGAYDGTFNRDWEYVAGAGDLDEFNGRTGVTPEYPQGTYYYLITDDFPFVPRYFRGTPDASFRKSPPPGGQGGPGGRPGGGAGGGPGRPGGPGGRPPRR